MPSPTQITVSQLSRLVGTHDCPAIIDVRIDHDFEDDPTLLPASFRHPHDRIDELVPQIQNDRAIVVCQKGKKLSEGAAAILRARGVMAETLEGGHFAWRDANQPLLEHSKLPPRGEDGKTRWVTRHRPKIDRIACPWLIRRFVDPRAEFLFVAPSEVEGVADKFSAIPFDIEDVFWSHRGNTCTFDTMIEEFGLQTEPLERLATIIRGADTDRHELAPEAAGLLAVSLGLSRMYRDDVAQLEAAMLVYDAFYRWARDASDEGHSWPAALNRS